MPAIAPVRSVLSLVQDLKTLGPKDWRRQTVTLVDTASPANAGVGNGDSYQVPSTHKFLITGIRGMIEARDLNVELVEAAPADLATNYAARLLARALRTTVHVWNKDRSEYITENTGKKISLAGICPLTGGYPLDFSSMPHVVMPGESIAMEVEYRGSGPNHLISGNGGVIPYDVGVTIDGILVPVGVKFPDRAGSSVFDFVRDMQGVTPDLYRRIALTLEANAPADLTEKATVQLRLPGAYNFTVFEIRGHATFDELNQESAAAAEPLALSTLIRQRLLARSSRTMARLRVSDNGEDRDIIKGDSKQTSTNGGGVTVASIFGPAGGIPFDFGGVPLLIGGGEILTMDLAWNGSRVALITGNDYPNNSRFGLTLVGAFVRR